MDLDPEKTQQVINRLIYRQKPEIAHKDLSVGILYSRSKEIDAFSLRDILKTAGYEVNCMGRSSQITKGTIIGYNTAVRDDLIKEMKKKIPEISKYEYIHQPIRNYCDASDIVITIKDDEIL